MSGMTELKTRCLGVRTCVRIANDTVIHEHASALCVQNNAASLAVSDQVAVKHGARRIGPPDARHGI